MAKAAKKIKKYDTNLRRYVTVECVKTGEQFQVLTSLIKIGLAVICFTPNNHDRKGALKGMLIIHDDITNAYCFADVEDFLKFKACGVRNGGNSVYREARVISE